MIPVEFDRPDDDDELDGAYTRNDEITCRTPIIVERSDGRQGVARGDFIWYADDPLTFTLHFEIMANSVCIDSKFYPTPEELPEGVKDPKLTCGNCDDDLDWGGMGAVVRDDEDPRMGALWCLSCADEHPSTKFIEALWVLSLEALQGVQTDSPPVAAGGAVARCWRLNENNYQVSLLTPQAGLLILTMPIDRLDLMMEAVNAYQFERGDQVENYLEKGLAELNALANKGTA